MQETIDAIVIRSRNYSDSSLIVNVYSRQKGLQSFIARGVRSKRKYHVMSLFQPLMSVEIVSYSKNKNAELKSLKEIKANYHYKTLHNNPVKASVLIFIAEVLDKVLREEEENSLLFEFLNSSLNYFDELDKYANFHISFLLELTKYLGFFPNIEDSSSYVFDLESGIVGGVYNNEINKREGSLIVSLVEFLGTNFVERASISLDRNKRWELLKLILDYYREHISGFKEIKSLEILKSLYDN